MGARDVNGKEIKKGDKVKIVSSVFLWGNLRKGEPYEVDFVDGDHSVNVNILEADKSDSWYYSGEDLEIVECAATEKDSKSLSDVTPAGWDAVGKPADEVIPKVPHKFKVGDKVVGTCQDCTPYSITKEGWEGEVKGVIDGTHMYVDGINGSKRSSGLHAEGFMVESCYFELLPEPEDSRYLPLEVTFNPDIPKLTQADTIEATLIERGETYGDFPGHAKIAQDIKRGMAASKNWELLPDDMKEALEMVAHKIGRILNGDYEYADSWHDVMGYTRLVEERLQP